MCSGRALGRPAAPTAAFGVSTFLSIGKPWSIRGLAFSDTDHKKCWEEIGSPEHCPICEYVATNNLRQIPFLIVVREALGNIYLAANKNSTPLQASASMGDVSHHLLS